MSTLFEPSSSMRGPFSSAQAPSVADTLPNINFGFDELRDRMAKFTAKFDTFIEAGRKRILEERNQFRMNIAELKEDDSNVRKRIEALEQASITHTQTLQRESAETREVEGLISILTSQRDAQSQQQTTLQNRISTIQSQITAKQSAQAQHASSLSTQSLKDIPELDFWVQNLGMRIEGAGVSDRIKFTFTLVDERDWSREAWFELNCGQRDYEIRKVWPKVEKSRVQGIVEVLNEKRDLTILLRGMRELFVEYFKENK